LCDSQIATIDLHHNWELAVQDVEPADGCQSTSEKAWKKVPE
jgi:hypothetical protein